MTSRAVSPTRSSRGHTLIELMIAIVCGMVLVLAAFKVLADFEGGKRTTTAMNDALQSGNIGLFEIDKLIRSAGTGMTQYARVVGYGCSLNYTPTGGGLITSGVINGRLPAPFTGVVGTSAAPLRLAPAVIFGGALSAIGFNDAAATTPATSDVLLFMLGGAGFGEIPVAVSNANAPPTLQSIVGFGPNDWVIDGGASLGDCMISKVSATFAAGGPGKANWTSSLLQLPLATGNSVGNKTLAVNDYILDLGNGAAANFLLFGVDPTSATLRSIDLLNSDPVNSPPLNVSDDVVLLKAIYLVDPDKTGTGGWVRPGGTFPASSGTYNYSATSGANCLLCGTSSANLALQGVKAIRIALVVRAPIQENANQAQNIYGSFNGQNYVLFSSVPTMQYTWYPPQGTASQPQNYRYRVIETTVPIRNNGLL